MIPVGFTLQPDEAFLDILGGVFAGGMIDYFEVAPETMWRADAAGALHNNGFRSVFSAIGARRQRAFVAHGVGFSVGSDGAEGSEGSEGGSIAAQRRQWLERLREDQRDFGFLWYTDHLGASSLGGMAMSLPMPLPMTASAAAVVRRSLAAMQSIVPDVGVENSVSYFLLGDPLKEPDFLKRILRAPRTHLLLDLHNVYTMAQNFGFDPDAYIDRLDLGRVIEIHVSGGSDSDPAWLPSGRAMRLDAHDSAVPEEVFSLFERAAPRCANLRGVTLERMEGTVSEADVPGIRGELRRIRRALRKLR